MKTNKTAEDKQKAADAINKIAKASLRISMLDTQHDDSLDFHDLAVWDIKSALEAAYRAGLDAGRAG